MKNPILAAIVLLSFPVHAGVTVVQNVAPGATSWPPTPVLSTMANPSSATIQQSFTNSGRTSLGQTFTITGTNYTLQQIDIYAGNGTGNGPGTNLFLRLFDLGFQTSPEPAPYGGVTPNETISANLFGSGNGLGIAYAPQANGILEFDFTDTDQVVLQAGHMYAFELGGGSAQAPVNWLSRTSGNPYSGGAAYTNKYWLIGSSSCDFSMAIYGSPTGNPAPPTPQTALSTVKWNDVRQRIDGFGASSAWRSSWTTAQADMLFSTNIGIGLSLLRTRIAPGGTTIENTIMQMARDRGARVWSSPWSPQTSFKDSVSLNGGNFVGNAANYQAYASQLAGYVFSMQNTYGVNIYAISVQNEPDVNTTGYESCAWTGTQIHDFVPYLNSALAANGVGSTKIIIPESQHWSSNPGLYTPTMTDATVATNVSIMADHNYDGINADNTATSVPSQINSPYPNTALWETEVSALKGSYSSIYNGVYWAGRIHAFMTLAQANAWHHWWLISGNNTANQGLFDVNGNATKRMYVMGNFSRFVRPNYYRIGTITNQGAAAVSAYKDPASGKFTIVAINSNPTASINLTVNLTNFSASQVTPWITSGSLSLSSNAPVTVANSSFTYTLPGPSVVTFVGQGQTSSIPTDLSLSSTALAEEQPAGTTVGTFSTADPGIGDTFTYSLVSGTGSADNSSFSISGNALQTSAVLDYEVQSSYSIRVRSTDQNGLSVEKVFIITLLDVNEAPTDISLSNSSILEGQPAGTVVGTFGTTDQDNGNTFTYTLASGAGGDDNGSFVINGNTLQTAATFNYSAQNTYTIRVRSTDQGALWTEKVFTVNVVAVPTDISLSNAAVEEGQPSGTAVGTFSTADPNSGDTFTYALVGGAGSTDNGSFTLSGNTLQSAAIFIYEARNSYDIRIRSTAQSGQWIEKAFTIGVTDNNVPANRPTNLYPGDGAVNQVLTPTLQASAFSDPNVGDSQTAGQWLIQRSADNAVVFDSGTDLTDTTNLTVSPGVLDYVIAYTWQVRYQDNHGAWSSYSASTVFTTVVPGLHVTAQPGEIVLSWPTNAAAFSLQFSADPSSASWTPVLTVPDVIGDQNVITNGIESTAGFFRLYKPQ